MSIETKNLILDNEPNLVVEPHHLNEEEAALIAAHIKRLKRNIRRRALYAQKQRQAA
jgi:hypothetical protein